MAVPVVTSPVKVAEEKICLLNKELVIKTPKRSPMLLRMVVLVVAMICGVYIFSTGYEELGPHKMAKLLNIQSIDLPNLSLHDQQQQQKQHCSSHNTSPSEESLYLHYPYPQTYSRQECDCNPVRWFALISMQRSGSGWFETLLNSHMNISSNGEIFGTSNRRSNVSALYHTLDTVYNLDWFSSASKNECSAAVGFKWMLNQGVNKYHEEIADYFSERGVSAVFLFRRNVLRRMVSLLANAYDKQARLLNGTHKSHVHSPLEAEVLAKYKPRINITTLSQGLKREEQMIANTLSYFNKTRHIVLFYEDVVRNRTKLREVQEFLGLPYRNLTSRQVKIHKGQLSNAVDNWDEVQKELKGTSYEKFLHKDYRR
ncbi:hypothetical protein V2J09_023900 [Rumex salicifolius]